VEMIADQLWIVQDGMVQAFDGDMADYQRQLLARRGAGGTARAARDDAGNLDQKPAGKPAGKIQSPGRVRRQNTSQLRAAVKQCEKAMVTLAADKDMIAREMARPSFYDSDNAAAIASLSSQLAAIDDALAAAEQAWLDAEEALAAAEADH